MAAPKGDTMAATASGSALALANCHCAARAGPGETAGRGGGVRLGLGGSFGGWRRIRGGGLRWGGEARRGRSLCIVAASPPKKDDGLRSGEPLTRRDLVAYLASGCKPKERWR